MTDAAADGPDDGQSNIGLSGVGEPEVGQWTVGQPGGGQSDMDQPDGDRLGEGQSDMGQLGVAQSEGAQSDGGQSDAGESDAGQPDGEQPDLATLSVGQCDLVKFAIMPRREREPVLRALGQKGSEDLGRGWRRSARPAQIPPAGDWFTWLIMAGRGFGKTRAGAEWVRAIAERQGDARIALVGASLQEARAIMVEGESGLLAIAPAERRPRWFPALRRLQWASGAQAIIYGAADPEALRGPQHSHAWADEIGKWPRGTAAWDNLAMGLRLGGRPRMMATTTPRPVALVRRLAGDPAVAITRGATVENQAALPAQFLGEMARVFGGTRLGRQELDGELLLDHEGALWTRDLLDRCRMTRRMPGREELARLVIGVDPPASAQGDACGIIVAALDRAGGVIVIDDVTVEKASPQRWARAVALAAARWRAERIVAEANNGGAMVEAVLRAADMAMPVKLVHAAHGKSARAEPIAAAYEAGRVRHAGLFSALEDQLCGLLVDGGYEGPGRSPDRADALVWAITELILSPVAHARVRTL